MNFFQSQLQRVPKRTQRLVEKEAPAVGIDPAPFVAQTEAPAVGIDPAPFVAEEEAPAVGIDLGTTYSCVGVWRNNKVEIIANEQGNRTTPSCVAFTHQERLIGEAALNQATRNPTNTIFDAKRLIGRRFSEESVQSDKMLWPFKVIAGDADRPTIVVNYMNQEKHFFAEEISSMILFKMKEIASTFVGHPVNKAVVTVPAYFNNSQRQATKDAAAIVGINILQVLNEPTAAALAYCLDNKDSCRSGEKLILVFDLGGGTFDVSLLQLDPHGVVEVKATCGDTHLGGQDFDNRMVDFLLKKYQEKNKEDLSKNHRCVRKMKAACERAKRVLSTQSLTAVEIECFHEGEDFSATFTQAKFEELNSDLFEKCMAPVKQCLQEANVDKKNINEVVLVGGSTRIQKVQDMLRSFFDGKELYKSINVDEAVAYGASIQAAILNGDYKKDFNLPKLVLLYVTPLSLGLNVYGGQMSVIIPKSTRIPCAREQIYRTSCDNQTEMGFRILEGERRMSADNNLLGEFVVSGIRPRRAGAIIFKCTFSMDANGILTVTARNEDNKEEEGMTITRDKLTLNQDEIDRMIRESKMYEHQDITRKTEQLKME